MEINIGDYRILDNSFYQYPSFVVYKVIDKIDSKTYTIKQIIRLEKTNPYRDSSFDIQNVNSNWAVIANSKDLNNNLIFKMIFEVYWDNYI